MKLIEYAEIKFKKLNSFKPPLPGLSTDLLLYNAHSSMLLQTYLHRKAKLLSTPLYMFPGMTEKEEIITRNFSYHLIEMYVRLKLHNETKRKSKEQNRK